MLVTKATQNMCHKSFLLGCDCGIESVFGAAMQVYYEVSARILDERTDKLTSLSTKSILTISYASVLRCVQLSCDPGDDRQRIRLCLQG